MRRTAIDERPSPTALVLVRNTVTRDSRVLREAAVLRDLGLRVLIVGVVSPVERETELELDGFPVIRLRLLEPLKALLRRRAAPAGPEAPTTSTRERAVPTTSGFGFHVRRLAVTLAYYVQGIVLVLRTSPSLIHANDYNTMWIGIAAKALRSSRLVYDAHELWPDRNGRPEWRPWLLACEWLFLRVADVTLTVSSGCANVIASRYRVPAPTVVRNIPDRVTVSGPRAETVRAGDDARLAVYVGAIAPGRGIEQAMDALAVACEFRLRLVGSSNGFEGHFEKLAQATKVSGRVEFRGLVSPSAVGAEIADAAMGLALIQPICLSYELSLPNKLFEYAAAGLPILASDLPVLGPLVRQEGIGEAVPPSDVESIVQAMRRLADPDRNAEVRARVRSFARRVTWDQERRLLENVYSSLLRPATAAS